MSGEYQTPQLSVSNDNSENKVAGHRDKRWPVPAILTPSFRVNASYFGENIRSLKAVKSHTDPRTININEEYGVTARTGPKDDVSIDYTRDMARAGDRFYAKNPLNDEMVESIMEDCGPYMSGVEDTADGPIEPDLAVREMSIEATSKALQEAANEDIEEEGGVSSDTFIFRFVSESADDQLEEKTKAADRGIGLYQMGCTHRHLNLHEVYETAPLDSPRPKTHIFQWGGLSDTDPLDASKVCAIMFREILPEDYRVWKMYGVEDGEHTRLIEGR